MLLTRKLLIAVLTIGLILSFGSAALSSEVSSTGKELTPTPTSFANPILGSESMHNPHPASPFSKPLSEMTALAQPKTVEAPLAGCETIDYSGGSAYYYWTIPNAYGTEEFVQRFTPTGACTLTALYVAVDNDQMVGTPDLLITLYEDDGFGFPGTVIDSWQAPYSFLSGLGAGAHYVGVSGLEYLFADGEDFLIGWATVQSDPGDVIAGMSDDGTAGSARSYEYWNAAYGKMIDNWTLDVNFLIMADVCYEETGDGPNTDCAWHYYNDGAVYYYTDEGGAVDLFNTRFDTDGPETLKTIEVVFYPSGFVGNPTCDIVVWASDAGFPDLTTEYARYPLTTGELDWPTTLDVSGDNIVINGTYHIGVDFTGIAGTDQLAIIGDDGTGGGSMMRNSIYYGGSWYTTADGYGADVGWLIYAYTCRDLYTECAWQVWHGDAGYIFTVPDNYGATGYATLFDVDVSGCAVTLFDWVFQQSTSTPGTYASDCRVFIADATGTNGLPGNILWEETLSPPYSYPAWNRIQPNYFTTENVWIGIESFSTTTYDLWFWTDDGSTPTGRMGELLLGDWVYMADDWGTDYDMYFEAYICCEPPEGDECIAGDDWPTMSQNYAGYNRTLNSLGDAKCKLTKSWEYIASNLMAFSSPVIYGDVVVGYFRDNLVALDIADGSEIWNLPYNGTEIGGACRAMITIEDDVIYTAGGDTRYFSALNLSDGSTIWTRQMPGYATYGANVIIGDAIWAIDDEAHVVVYNTADGTDYFGTGTNPVLTGNGLSHKAICTDGDYVYVGIDAAFGAANLYKIDATDPSIVTNLIDDGDGFQLATLYPEEASAEGIYHGMAIRDGSLYMVTSFTPTFFSTGPETKNGGLMYAINAADLTIQWTHLCNGSNNGAPGNVILDINYAIFGGWSHWGSNGAYWGPCCFKRNSGALVFTTTATNPDTYQHVVAPGLLTCEDYTDPAVADYLIVGNSANYFNFHRVDMDGGVEFHRRFFYGTGYLDGPIMDETNLLLTVSNYIACMRVGTTDRPRLHLPNMEIVTPVEFGQGSSVTVEFPDAINNNGCADLTVNGIYIDVADNGTYPLNGASVGKDRADDMNIVADKLAPNYREMVSVASSLDALEDVVIGKKSSMRNAAYAPPVFVNGVISPVPGTLVAPDETISIVLDIDGTQLPRGYSAFFAYIDTDDPDYFVDYAYMDDNLDYAIPSIRLACVGGCLTNFTVLHFGMGGANFVPVYNTTKIMIDAETDGGISIDGVADYVFGGDGLVYAKDTILVAMHWDDPWSNADFRWDGILPDLLDGSCDFFVYNNVLLAKLSRDNGGSYVDIFGDIINYAYLDSIQDYSLTPGDLTTWEWEYEWVGPGTEPPYSAALTDGFAFRTIVAEYGVSDVAEFTNFMIARHDCYSRYGYAIDDVFVGGIADFDIGDYSQAWAGYDEDHSVAFMYDQSNPTAGWGYIKVPFGPGFEPMLNSINADYTDWYFAPSENFDSIYVWMAERRGSYNIYPLGQDKRLFWTMAELDMPAWDYVSDTDPVPDSAFTSYGYVFFGLNGLADATDPSNYFGLANFANQFCGFGRGDVNNDGAVNLVDVIYLNNFAFHGGDGPYPFEHLGDVNGDGDTDVNDIFYLLDWYFNGGPAPVGDWALPFSGI